MKKIGLIGLVVVALFVLSGCGNAYQKLETDLKDKAAAYYDKYINGYVTGITEQKVTLAMLDKVNTDIKSFNTQKCDKDASYALVVLKFDSQNKATGKYTVRSHIKCQDYESK